MMYKYEIPHSPFTYSSSFFFFLLRFKRLFLNSTARAFLFNFSSGSDARKCPSSFNSCLRHTKRFKQTGRHRLLIG